MFDLLLDGAGAAAFEGSSMMMIDLISFGGGFDGSKEEWRYQIAGLCCTQRCSVQLERQQMLLCKCGEVLGCLVTCWCLIGIMVGGAQQRCSCPTSYLILVLEEGSMDSDGRKTSHGCHACAGTDRWR
jgi:hypothetical protein